MEKSLVSAPAELAVWGILILMEPRNVNLLQVTVWDSQLLGEGLSVV